MYIYIYIYTRPHPNLRPAAICRPRGHQCTPAAPFYGCTRQHKTLRLRSLEKTSILGTDVCHYAVAHTTLGSSSLWCSANRMCNPTPASMTTASGSIESSRMMVYMRCRRSAGTFSLMAVHSLSAGMLATSAANAFWMVSAPNGRVRTLETPDGTPKWNPFQR